MAGGPFIRHGYLRGLGHRAKCRRGTPGCGPRGGRLRNGSAGCGAAWLARLLWEQEAAGSNPAIPTTAIPTSSEHMPILIKAQHGSQAAADRFALPDAIPGGAFAGGWVGGGGDAV